MPLEITYETALILATFVIIVFVIYRVFKMALRGALVAIAAFSFPWIVDFLNLGLPITASAETGIQFALLGIALFLIYEFAHLIIRILKILSWPFRRILRRR